MTRYIEAKVICGGFSSGQKIASLRQLTVQFGISLNTARRGIAGLVKKGLLEFRHGSGTYVANRQRFPSPCVIGFVHSFTNPTERSLAFSGLAVLGAEEQAHKLSVQTRSFTVTAEEMNDRKAEQLTQGLEGLILMGGYDHFLTRPHLGIPAVGLTMHQSLNGWFSLIDLDPFRAAELACDFFFRQRRKKIIIIRKNRPNFLFREEQFIRKWQELNPQPTESIEGTVTEYDSTCGYLYTCGTEATDDARRNTRQTHRLLGEDHAVLCIDGKPMFTNPITPELPTIAINWRAAGQVAMDECLRRISHPGSAARRIYLAPELYCI